MCAPTDDEMEQAYRDRLLTTVHTADIIPPVNNGTPSPVDAAIALERIRDRVSSYIRTYRMLADTWRMCADVINEPDRAERKRSYLARARDYEAAIRDLERVLCLTMT